MGFQAKLQKMRGPCQVFVGCSFKVYALSSTNAQKQRPLKLSADKPTNRHGYGNIIQSMTPGRNEQTNIMSDEKHLSRGFTLIEVMIAMAIAGIVTAAIYAVFISQSKTYSAQEQIVDLQRGLRFGMSLLERDLRQAGYNPGALTKERAESDGVDNDCDGATDETDNTATWLVNESESIGILEASVASISFSIDVNGDGSACGEQERVTFALDGLTLKRNDRPLIDNVEVLNFVYLAGDGGVANSVEEIRSVQIAIVGRTHQEDPSYENTQSYVNLPGTEILAAQNDGYRRRILTTQVNFRNLND